MSYPPTMPARIQITKPDHVFVLTGAGISAESGLRTFRDSGGLWEGHDVQQVASPEGWASDPELVWRFYSLRRQQALHTSPNSGHRALALLEASLGDNFFLCTQNVDHLHELAGSRRILHMHGKLFSSRCSSGCARPSFPDENLYLSLDRVPRCACGARIRPDIVWFGESIRGADSIQTHLQSCTLFLAIGTSGTVYPAASFARLAKSSNCARSIYLGPEPPANRSVFDEILIANATDLSSLIALKP